MDDAAGARAAPAASRICCAASATGRALTQEELAERAGLTAKAIGALERGERRRPYPHTVRSLADALGLDDAERASVRGGGPPRRRPASGRCGRRAGQRAAAAPAAASWWAGTPTRAGWPACCARGATRLLTLTGPGGVGKTRLALAVARRPGRRVRAARSRSSSSPRCASRASCCRRSPAPSASGRLDGPASTGWPTSLGDRRLLVVLDNLEHVLGVGAGRRRAAGALPGSRRAGHQPGAAAGPRRAGAAARAAPAAAADDAAAVAGFARRPGVPRPGAGRRRRDVALDRRANRPDVAAICRRLDGLPLALELAAAHARFLPPAQLLARLDAAVSSPRSRDLPERQRTMRATLDWSHDLLTADEQALLRRLAVFAGGFDLDAVEAVSGARRPRRAGRAGGAVARGRPSGAPLPDAGAGPPVRRGAAWPRPGRPRRRRRRGRALPASSRPAARDRAAAAPTRREWLDRLQVEHGNLSATWARLLAARRARPGGPAGRRTRGCTGRCVATRVEGLGWLDGDPGPRRLDPRPSGRPAGWRRRGLRYASGDVAGTAAPRRPTPWPRLARRARRRLLAEALVLAGTAAVVPAAAAGARRGARRSRRDRRRPVGARARGGRDGPAAATRRGRRGRAAPLCTRRRRSPARWAARSRWRRCSTRRRRWPLVTGRRRRGALDRLDRGRRARRPDRHDLDPGVRAARARGPRRPPRPAGARGRARSRPAARAAPVTVAFPPVGRRPHLAGRRARGARRGGLRAGLGARPAAAAGGRPRARRTPSSSPADRLT